MVDLPFRPRLAAVGSLNRAKVAATRQVVGSFWPAMEVVAVDVSSSVASQPCGEEETAAGALNRARAAAALVPDVDFAVGLEGGVVYHSGLDSLFITAWAAVLIRGRIEPCYGHGGLIPLPLSWRERLQSGAELGPLVEGIWGDLADRQQGGAVAALTLGLVQRVDYLARALQFALVPLLRPALFADEIPLQWEE